ncbi:MAG: hypothetical protein AAFY71_19840 [Bacteroidota bacterium]
METVSIESFIEEELDNLTKKNLLDKISNGKLNSLKSQQIVFNRFIIEIKFSEKRVVIIDDAFFEETIPLELSLSDFIKKIDKA